MELLERAVARRGLFVPGEPFYTAAGAPSTFRLNFSCIDEPGIADGISRIAEGLEEMIA